MLKQHPLRKPDRPVDIPAGFSIPNWNAPLDVDQYMANVPESATVKGMFFQAIYDEAGRRNVKLEPRQKYYPFHSYPLKEGMEVVLESAAALFPDKNQRDGVRHVCHLFFGTFVDTSIGKVIFGVLGQKIGSIMKHAPRGFGLSQEPGRIEVVEIGDQHAILKGIDIYAFGETFAVGSLEGTFTGLNRAGLVAQKIISPTEVDAFIAWEDQ